MTARNETSERFVGYGEMTGNIPNLFIVGAQRSGTTSLYNYLSSHPDIFMSRYKEPHFFMDDYPTIRFKGTLADYLALFQDAGNQKYLGEASSRYLYSKKAARSIYNFNPHAKIIISLRNPITMVPSLHTLNLLVLEEDVSELKQALLLEPKRRKGECIPSTCTFVPGLYYSEIAKYHEQVLRYIDVFGRSAVKIIIFDDFVRDPQSVFVDLLQFLDLDPEFTPTFKRFNRRAEARSRFVAWLIKTRKPEVLKALVDRFVPFDVKLRVYDTIRRANSRPAQKQQPIDDETLNILVEYYREDIERLSALLGRDLTGLWLGNYDRKAHRVQSKKWSGGTLWKQ